MKKLIIAALVIVSFASCDLYNETHTFVHRERIAGVLIVTSKVITSTTSYCRGQMINIDGRVWVCQN